MPGGMGNNHHQFARTLLRVAGLLLLVGGVGCIATAIIDFFTIDMFQGPFGGGPTKSYFFFIGIPLLFAGSVMTSYGFMGAVAKYQSRELTPVVTDTFNHLAEGTQSGVRNVSRSIAEGYRQGFSNQQIENGTNCVKCQTLNDEDAKFCKACGETIATMKICSACRQKNDPDAAYCTDCGARL